MDPNLENEEFVDNEILENEEVEEMDESVASDTLKPGGNTRAEMLATFTSLLSQLGKDDLSHFLNDALKQIDTGNVPTATAPGKTGLGQMPMAKLGVKEDVEEMFADENLTEEFKERAETIFEAAVHARVVLERTKLEEEFETALAEEVEEVRTEITDKLDQYLDYVVEQWIEENQIAIENSLRTQIAEDFIGGLRNLFAESYITVPEESVDVLGELSAQVEELQARLDEEINAKMDLEALVNEAHKEATFDDVTEGLAATQIEKLRTLVEGIEYSDIETYKKKLDIVKEKYFGEKTSSSTQLIREDTDGALDEAPNVPASMAKYVNAISKTLK
jgi:hypothetical protein